jgi:NADPH-dependent curcumin reductase CurA
MNRQWRISARPSGRMIEASDFSFTAGCRPAPTDGQVLVNVSHLAFDPSMKSWMENAVSYFPPTAIGDVMPGEGYGVVVGSRHPRYAAGDAVTGFFGWQDFAAVDGALLRRPPPDVAPTPALSVLGSSGLTAFFGLFDVGRPLPGDLLVVSSAAGAVGSMAGQLGRIAGCRVIGLAGSPEKCAWLTAELGFDHALDYRREDVAEGLRRLAPHGVDIFFDNVGGDTLNTVLGVIARRARVIICGGMSRHEPGRRPAELDNYYNLVFQRARMEGFNVVDSRDRYGMAMARLEGWLRAGQIRCRAPRTEGLEAAPQVLMGLFEGQSLGKQVLRIAPS